MYSSNRSLVRFRSVLALVIMGVIATTPVLATTVTLAWDASPTPSVGYNVYRGTASGGPYVLVNATTLNVLTFADTESFTAGQTYYYVVRAVLNGLESANSNEVAVPIPPAPPANLRITVTISFSVPNSPVTLPTAQVGRPYNVQLEPIDLGTPTKSPVSAKAKP